MSAIGIKLDREKLSNM